jgi:hypothetical protein
MTDPFGLQVDWQKLECALAMHMVGFTYAAAVRICVLAFVPGEGGGIGDVGQLIACASAIGSFLAALAWARHACFCYPEMLKKLEEHEQKIREIQKKLDEIKKLLQRRGISSR